MTSKRAHYHLIHIEEFERTERERLLKGWQFSSYTVYTQEASNSKPACDQPFILRVLDFLGLGNALPNGVLKCFSSDLFLESLNESTRLLLRNTLGQIIWWSAQPCLPITYVLHTMFSPMTPRWSTCLPIPSSWTQKTPLATNGGRSRCQ